MLGVTSNNQNTITGGIFDRASEQYVLPLSNKEIDESSVNISYSSLSQLTFTASNATSPLILVPNAIQITGTVPGTSTTVKTGNATSGNDLTVTNLKMIQGG